MSLTVRRFDCQVKDSQTGVMKPAGLLSSDAIGAINNAKDTAVAAVQAQGAATIASIPSDYTALDTEVDDLKNAFGITVTEILAYDAYSQENASVSTSTTAPFILFNSNFDYSGKFVAKIKLRIVTPGTLSIGVVKRSDAILGGTFDRSRLILKDTLNITSAGEQEIILQNSFTVAADEYIYIGNTTDTAQWNYGANGTDTSFYYIGLVDGNNIVVRTYNSLGVNIYASETSDPLVRQYINSIYVGKTMSILGDSISTFSGFIPAGNATYYPAGDVQSVTDTWWKKLIDALGMTINVNNSWSGSRVTTTGGTESAGCGDRAEALGTDPDVIIVWMGINDFNNEVNLGTYDGKTVLPNATTTFREAYAIMLNKILTKYKTSEVWVCTLPECERNADETFPEINGNGIALIEFNNAIKEIADAFGVKILEHDKCGLTYQNMPIYNPDKLHPNAKGHSLIANNDIREMDNAVLVRYQII